MVLKLLKALFKQPQPAGPPVTLRTFGIDAQPLTKDYLTVDGDGWRIDINESQSTRLFEVRDPGVEQCLLAYRSRVKTENAAGRFYLEMWCSLPGRGEFFSKGLNQAVKGTTDWVTHETPFFLKKGQRPDLIKLNIFSEAPGTIWIKDIELLQTPLE